MKNNYTTLSLIVIAIILVISCRSKEVAEPKINTLPTAPTSLFPSDKATGISIETTLSWTASSDADKDTITYDIYFGQDNPPTSKVSSKQTEITFRPPNSLANEETYYWKVIAKDPNGGETSSEVWSFTTSAVPNQPPSAPSSPNPQHQATQIALDTALSWEKSTDPEESAPLTYDIYFGQDNPPTNKVSFNQTETTYRPPDSLANEKTYYWKVIAKDPNGGETSSEVWSFTTSAAPNQSPAVPILNFPADNAMDIAIDTSLLWQVVIDPDGQDVTYDVYLGTSNNPPKVTSSSITDTSYTPASPLSTNTIYYWKVVAKDGEGGETENAVQHFTTIDSHDASSITWTKGNGDVEGDKGHFIATHSRYTGGSKQYNVVKLGNQVWMAENLAWFTASHVTSGDWQTKGGVASTIYGASGDYVSHIESVKKNTQYVLGVAINPYRLYGVLYSWQAAMIACPSSWHLPTDEEWKELEQHLGLTEEEANKLNQPDFRGTIGKKLAASTGWRYSNGSDDVGNDPSTNNSSGFSALAGSYRIYEGTFVGGGNPGAGSTGQWWSATPEYHGRYWIRQLEYQKAGMGRKGDRPYRGSSVRCVKD